MYQGLPVTTDATGSGITASPELDLLPLHVGFAVYRDTNGNSRWDPDADGTVYRGSGTINACPQTVTLSSK